MKKILLKHGGIGFLFILLTLLMTYPLGINIGSAVNDTEDALLNTWILSWDINQIINLNFSHFFDANIFYPHQKVLAYSEHLFSLALIALPVKLLFNNPILAYNFTLLFAFFMCGFGMYLLAFYFTKDHWAAFAGGIIYAFAPYKFAHLCHIQVVSAWAIPLSFLYLHKYLSDRRARYLLLFTLFFLFQALGNGYFALYLTLFLGLAILYIIVKEKRYHDRNMLIQFSFFIFVVLVVTIPFFYPYVVVRKEMNFMRNDLFWADISSYLAAGPSNFLYGKITSLFLRQEGELFPGVMAMLLCFLGVRSVNVRQARDIKRNERIRKYNRLNKVINLLMLSFLLIAVVIVITGGYQGSFLGISFSAKTPRGFILYIFVLFLIRLIYDQNFRDRVKRKLPLITNPDLKLYFWIGVASFLFTLGPEIYLFKINIFPLGPYEFLRIFVPGFDGLRVSSRFFVFVLLSLAIFSSIGFKSLLDNLRKKKKVAALIFIPAILLFEYLSIPLSMSIVQVNDQIPKVYQWLKKQEGQFALIELPLPKPWIEMAKIEVPRVYFSSYHWKKLFNGYSGYYPPVYIEMMIRFSDGPVMNRINDLKELGIKYLVIHLDQYKQKDGQDLIEDLTSCKQGRFVAEFENDRVFELKHRIVKEDIQKSHPWGAKISSRDWVLSSNVNPDSVKQANDNREETYWRTGRSQIPGDFFTVDLNKPIKVNGLSFKLGSNYYSYPRGYLLEGSMDGRNWFFISRRDSYKPPISIFLNPRAIVCPILFPPTTTRFLRLTNTRSHDSEWAIAELEVFIPNS